MHSIPTHAAPTRGLRQRKYQDDLEDVILQRMRTEAQSDRARSELAAQTGIADETLLEELSNLGFTSRTLVALRLIPLLSVAWADKHVDASERAQVLKAAAKIGIIQGSGAYVLLEHWLREPPPAESVDAWKRYMRRVMSKLGVKAQQKLVNLIRGQMMTIAKASGGHFGIGRVSAKERHTIDGFVKALQTNH